MNALYQKPPEVLEDQVLPQSTEITMETLSDEVWDVIIAGTSIPQSLLAL